MSCGLEMRQHGESYTLAFLELVNWVSPFSPFNCSNKTYTSVILMDTSVKYSGHFYTRQLMSSDKIIKI